MRHTLIAIASLALISACQPDSPDTASIQSPAMSGKMRAFRSVLDGKPRVLTVRLSDDLSLAYDTSAGTLFKVWDGQVNFSGPVYDQKHGPQPTTPRRDYLLNESARWQGGVEYLGYRLNGDTTTLLYGSGQVQIEETPGYRPEADSVVVTRQFHTRGGSAVMSGLKLPERFTLTGAGAITGDTLTLREGDTRLTLYYPPLPARAGAAQAKEAPVHPGAELIANSDCAACHNPQVKTVGPAYRAIARRYGADPRAKETLAQKIIDGGAGNWGQVAMTPHPDLSLADAATMAEYILSLDSPAETAAGDPMARPPLPSISGRAPRK